MYRIKKIRWTFCFNNLLQKLTFLSLLMFVLFLTGCSKLIQPYSGKFKCPPTYAGICESMEQAYEDSILGIDPRKFDKDWVKKRKKWEKQHKELLEARKRAKMQAGIQYDFENTEITIDKALGNKSQVAKEYRRELFKELHFLLTEPETPFVAPPKIVRVLVLSTIAKEENEKSIFISPRYVYFMLDSPRWILHKLPEHVPFDPANPMLKNTSKKPIVNSVLKKKSNKKVKIEEEAVKEEARKIKEEKKEKKEEQAIEIEMEKQNRNLK